MKPTPPAAAGDMARLVTAALAVTATYGYFLLFAEFAFLKHARLVSGDSADLRGVMAALGAGGIAGSLATLWRFRPEAWAVRLAGSYAACAVLAAIAPFATGATLITVAAGIGLALGWNTVTLASGLRAMLPVGQLGLGIGLGTGTAYALCNVPVIFTAGATVQAGISAGLMAVAAVGLRGADPEWSKPASASLLVTWRWVGVFFSLVWLDSAAFYIIQQTPVLPGSSWSTAAGLWGNAVVHFAAALFAGRLLDRGCLRSLTLAAWTVLAGACLAFGSASPVPAAGLLYAGSVSAYSAALVFFAARDGRPRIAAAVFAVAGWLGSALGIGIAQDLPRVPSLLVVASALGMGLALWPGRRRT